MSPLWGMAAAAWWRERLSVMDDLPVPGDQAGPFTLLNVFRVAPASQDSLASSVLATAADIAASLPGFLDATVLRSVDGQRVANYAHWSDRAAFEAFMADSRTPARLRAATELGEPDGHAYVIAGRVGAPAPAGPLAVYRRMQQLIGEQAWDQLSEVVDAEGYTENCVGLTPGWITGLAAAVANYLDNVASGISDITITELDALQTGDSALIRARVDAAHTGPFLGVAATGRRFSFESLDFVKLTAGRIGWRWLLMDLWGARQQLTTPTAAARDLPDRTS
jgi:heme-degrading monooxygenase HmoA/predicted ester cyclase